MDWCFANTVYHGYGELPKLPMIGKILDNFIFGALAGAVMGSLSGCVYGNSNVGLALSSVVCRYCD